jgi:HEAT repeat protein
MAVVGFALACGALCADRAPQALDEGFSAGVPLPILNLVLWFWKDDAEKLYAVHISTPTAWSQSGWPGATPVLPSISDFEKLLIASRIQPVDPQDPRSLPSALGQSDHALSQRALLSGLGAELRPSLPVLVEYARDIRPSVRDSCIELISACARGGSYDAASALLKLCRSSEDEDVRTQAMSRLIWSVSAMPKFRPLLRKATESDLSPECEKMAVGAFCRTAGASEVRHVRRLLKHPDDQLRVAVIQGLEGAGSTVPEELLDDCCRLLESDQAGSVRLAAARLAKQRMLIGESQWIRAIERAAQDPEPSVQKECFTLLSNLISTSVEAQEAAKRAITSDAAEQYRAMLVFHVSLTMGESRIPFLRSVVDRNSSGIVRAVAVRELLTVSGREGLDVEYFVGLLADKSPEVVHAAANCLGRLGEESRPHLDELKAVRLHPDVAARAGIEGAIRRIETGEWDQEP